MKLLCILAAAAAFFSILTTGCATKVIAKGHQPAIPAVLPTERTWQEQPFSKVSLVRTVEGEIKAEVWVKRLDQRETAIQYCNWNDGAPESGVYIVTPSLMGMRPMIYQHLPTEVHQPLTGTSFLIRTYQLELNGHVISTLER